MRNLLISSLLVTGLALGGVTGVYAADEYGNTQESEMTGPDTGQERFSGEGHEYTVREGDTLASIAEAELGSADQWQIIARANGIENPDQLEVGQTLTIPESGERSDAGAADSAESTDVAARNPGDAAQPEEQSYDQQQPSDAADSSDAAMTEEQEIKGEITEIGSGNDSLMLTDESGMTHNFKLDDEEMLEGIAVGDFVKVELDGGTVVSLEKVDRNV